MAEIHAKRIDERKVPTVLCEDICIEGDLNFINGVVFKGQLKGNIVSKDMIVVGKSAQIHGNLRGVQVRVYGTVIGDISGEEMVILESSAKVMGDVKTPKIEIEGGCVFEGISSMRISNSNF